MIGEKRENVQSLERICRSNGYPKTIRVDQGSEFIAGGELIMDEVHRPSLVWSRRCLAIIAELGFDATLRCLVA